MLIINMGKDINKKIIIREALISDADNLLAYRKRVYGETDFLLNSQEEFLCTVEDQVKFLENTVNRNTGCFFIALHNDRIVGSAGMHWSNKKRIRHCGDYGTAVLKEYWGQGVATMLLNGIINIAPTCGITKINLETIKNNKSAIKLYKKFGFLQEGLKVKSFRVNDIFYDVVVMGKIL